MTLRSCTGCRKDLPAEAFYRGKRTKCRKCLSAEARAKYQQLGPDKREQARATAKARRDRNRQFMDELKAGPCTDCGGTYPPECMDWDHVRGDKLADVGSLLQATRERILAEVTKCELVCANCHRTRSRNRLAAGQPVPRSVS